LNTNIFFVRHAHSTYTPNELGRPLSERGFQDAQKVTEILKQEKINIILSSPYKRAVQTVEGIANFAGSNIVIEEDLKERKLAGNPVDDFVNQLLQKCGRITPFLGRVGI
jgi:2,3-bisphosphoglycerate-dependent phosphoglycerate mutase